MRSDTSGPTGTAVDAVSRLREALPFPEGTTLQQLAESVQRDEEETLAALITAACEGWVETDLFRWRPRSVEGEE